MKNLFLFIFTLVLFSCTNTEETLPEKDPKNKKEISKFKIELDTANFGFAKNLTEFKQTEFLPTLESKFDKNKNGIYAASLLFAWDEIRNALKSPIENIESKQLQEINNSETFKNVLTKKEYITEVVVTDSSINASAYFKKQLPFVTPLKRKRTSIKFNKEEVENFGFYGKEYEHDIIYYNNDNDFAIRLNPKDENHEIILVLTDFKDSTIIEAWRNLNQNQKTFQKHRHTWKSNFISGDKVSIPLVKLNLKTNYNNIKGSFFKANGQLYKVIKAHQQTAFILDEKGAKIESYADMAVDAASEPFGEENPKPKNLIFDKPFIIFLKRKDSHIPYFAAYICNTELMKEFKNKEK